MFPSQQQQQQARSLSSTSLDCSYYLSGSISFASQSSHGANGSGCASRVQTTTYRELLRKESISYMLMNKNIEELAFCGLCLNELSTVLARAKEEAQMSLRSHEEYFHDSIQRRPLGERVPLDALTRRKQLLQLEVEKESSEVAHLSKVNAIEQTLCKQLLEDIRSLEESYASDCYNEYELDSVEDATHRALRHLELLATEIEILERPTSTEVDLSCLYPLFDKLRLETVASTNGAVGSGKSECSVVWVNGRRLSSTPLPSIQLNWGEINGAWSTLASLLLSFRSLHNLPLKMNLGAASHWNATGTWPGTFQVPRTYHYCSLNPVGDRVLINLTNKEGTIGDNLVLEGGVHATVYCRTILVIAVSISITALELWEKSNPDSSRKSDPTILLEIFSSDIYRDIAFGLIKRISIGFETTTHQEDHAYVFTDCSKSLAGDLWKNVFNASQRIERNLLSMGKVIYLKDDVEFTHKLMIDGVNQLTKYGL